MARRGLSEPATPFTFKDSAKSLERIRALPARQRITVDAGLVQTLIDRAEAIADVRAFDTAKAAGGALIPADVMDRIWNGENRVLVFREWRGLKQGGLAKAAKLSQAYLCEIEKGKNLSARAARALAKALKVDIGDLLVG